MGVPAAFERLMLCLARLPGVGRRSAERIALRLVRGRDALLDDMIGALSEARALVCSCSLCGSITDRDRNPCELCSGAGRDEGLLCVVEEPGDILLIERSGGFKGRYHALMGKLSPGRGNGPDEIRIDSLLKRVSGGSFREVILALSTDVEGDATASYIVHRLSGSGVRISRLAFGLPAGSGIAYSDPVTLARAIRGRTDEEGADAAGR